ncbi:hypothetical protein [Brevundimonas sp.]|uniref:hypothetical protein n=1 Tax=Brevundimonas sp. TaxID=1871086 RepID=UPI002AB84F94|nr:hypothetical protein [Brevundimonas sp.]MDZ4364158.1 hypothetical protein [Brevundimonas sp.]
MKTTITALTFAAATLCATTLCAGSVLAQTRPQTPAPRTGVASPPPAIGTVPTGQGQGQTRGTLAPEGGTIAGTLDGTGALAPKETDAGVTFGGRLTIGEPTGPRVINNSETDIAPGGGQPVAAEAPINTSRSNIRRPSLEVEGNGATTTPAQTWTPLVPRPQEPTTIGQGDRRTPTSPASPR